METMFVKGNSFILSRGVFQLRISLTTKQNKTCENDSKYQKMAKHDFYGQLLAVYMCQAAVFSV